MALYINPLNRTARRVSGRPYRRMEWTDSEMNNAACDVLVPVNVKAGTDEFVITALLPGVKADDLAIQVVNETVTLQGELKASEEEKETFLVRECPIGRFYRVIRLPEALDANKAQADLVDGVLTLRVPKAEEARPKTIKVISKN